MGITVQSRIWNAESRGISDGSIIGTPPQDPRLQKKEIFHGEN
jgi:hypothetical protein